MFKFDFVDEHAVTDHIDVKPNVHADVAQFAKAEQFTFDQISEQSVLLLAENTKCHGIYKRILEDAHFSMAATDTMAELESNPIFEAQKQNHDVISSVYEGGMKTWECSYDLVEYLSVSRDFEGKDVLELGCGSALPGLYALFNLKPQSVSFQDYNKEVLEFITIPNIVINKLGYSEQETDDQKDMEFEVNNIRTQLQTINGLGDFFYGSWASLSELCSTQGRFDVLLSSETIYDERYYGSIANVLRKTLKDDGYALFACKEIYFACTGNLFLFKEFMIKSGFSVSVVWQNGASNGLKRVILKITKT